MSRTIRGRPHEPLSSAVTGSEPPIASLVDYLHREAQMCIASFSEALTAGTRATVDGVADLIAGERSVLLDFSRVDVVDAGGADAVEVLVDSVHALGRHLQTIGSRGRMSGGFRASP